LQPDDVQHEEIVNPEMREVELSLLEQREIWLKYPARQESDAGSGFEKAIGVNGI
jgi:hypothetical protein